MCAIHVRNSQDCRSTLEKKRGTSFSDSLHVFACISCTPLQILEDEAAKRERTEEGDKIETRVCLLLFLVKTLLI